MSSAVDLRSVTRKLVARADLTEGEVGQALGAVLSGQASEAAIAAFLVALAMKGETADELRAILKSIKSHATQITPRVDGTLIDTCGTGGDSIRSFNISTAAAIVASAAGARVAKHGNRSVSGVCGSADFLEFVGLDLDVAPDRVQRCIESAGIGFLFAPAFHPSMKNVAPARKTIGIRTAFNVVGPLSNPCTNITGQVIGVYEPSIMEILAEACQGHVSEAMIVHAHDGFDELSNTCENDILWVSDRQVKRMRLRPKIIGMKVAKPEQLAVRTKEESIKSTLQAICGKAPAEKEDAVVLNAAAALAVAKVAPGIKEGVDLARGAIKSGKARDKLSQLIKNCGSLEKLKEAEEKFL